VKNTVDARVSFSFKGENYVPSMTIDLDALIKVSGDLSDLYSTVARHNNIDTYSYLFEVMESSEIYFENATGLAANCVVEGKFDLQQFESLWRNQHASAALQLVAKKYMAAANMGECPGLMDALFEAYRLGQQEDE